MQNASAHQHRSRAGLVGGIFAVFVLTVACYWPSLSGPFVFDDIPNLELMGDRGGLTSAERYLEFVTTPQSGPLGRPLSLVSFTLNAQDWPADPYYFRVTNLVIHLVNGLLIFFLARGIFSIGRASETAEKLALLCAALWLLHPLLVSTTAYVIQRMTQLSTFFTLTGLLCYMHGRLRLLQTPRLGWAWIIAGMGTAGVLALLTKENGILLPLYALLIEITLFRSLIFASRHRRALIVVLCAPLCALLVYLLIDYQSLASAFEFKPFTVTERLMTQPVVLMDYLQQILVPQLSGLGIIHDDYTVSRSLLDPVATLISMLAIAGLIVLAVWSRRKWPLVSLGILWFLAGHSLEAGPIPLELYFEHRNYLPSLGPLMVLVSFLPYLRQLVGKALPFIVLLLLAIESFLTWQAAITWGSEERLMRTALIEHPTSLRAQQHVANRLIIAGRYDEALAMQEELAALHPMHTATQLSILNLRCILGILSKPGLDLIIDRLGNSNHDFQLIGYFGPLLKNVESRRCPELDFSALQSVFDTLLSNDKIAAHDQARGAIHYHKGIVFKLAGELRLGIEQMDLSYEANPEIDIRLLQTVWLLGAGQTTGAQHYLSLARAHRSNRLLSRNFRESDIEVLQQAISGTTR